jgi:hypothetical protein
MSLCEKPLAEMGTEKSGAAGDENPFHPVNPPWHAVNSCGWLHPRLDAAPRPCFSGNFSMTLL